MTSEHIESMTKIENARHQIKLSQKENLYHLLKDRELDPWTQSRLDSIQTKYNQLKHDLNVLLQLTHTTIHDKSLTTDNDQTENEFVAKKKLLFQFDSIFVFQRFSTWFRNIIKYKWNNETSNSKTYTRT